MRSGIGIDSHRFAAGRRLVLGGVEIPYELGLDGFFERNPTSALVVPCGGATRAQSVQNGLYELRRTGATENDWVLVHDAARCLVTPQLIDRLIDA